MHAPRPSLVWICCRTKQPPWPNQGLFRGGRGGAFAPLGIDLPPLGNWLSLYLIGVTPPLRIWICSPLKFATMRLPPLEWNPEINPANSLHRCKPLHLVSYWLASDMVSCSISTTVALITSGAFSRPPYSYRWESIHHYCNIHCTWNTTVIDSYLCQTFCIYRVDVEVLTVCSYGKRNSAYIRVTIISMYKFLAIFTIHWFIGY